MMVNAERPYKLTGSLKRKLETEGAILICRKCRKPLKLGDDIISKTSNGRRHYGVRRYHKHCYLSMFIEA